jgi:hypothetical protein
VTVRNKNAGKRNFIKDVFIKTPEFGMVASRNTTTIGFQNQ